MEAVTVFCLFLNILINLKAQRKMILLFYQAEIRIKDGKFVNLLIFAVLMI